MSPIQMIWWNWLLSWKKELPSLFPSVSTIFLYCACMRRADGSQQPCAKIARTNNRAPGREGVAGIYLPLGQRVGGKVAVDAAKRYVVYTHHDRHGPLRPFLPPEGEREDGLRGHRTFHLLLAKNSHLRGFLSYERPVAPLWELERKAH